MKRVVLEDQERPLIWFGDDRRFQAHRTARLREAVDVLSFFAVVVLIVLFLSVDGIH